MKLNATEVASLLHASRIDSSGLTIPAPISTQLNKGVDTVINITRGVRHFPGNLFLGNPFGDCNNAQAVAGILNLAVPITTTITRNILEVTNYTMM